MASPFNTDSLSVVPKSVYSNSIKGCDKLIKKCKVFLKIDWTNFEVKSVKEKEDGWNVSIETDLAKPIKKPSNFYSAFLFGSIIEDSF